MKPDFAIKALLALIAAGLFAIAGSLMIAPTRVQAQSRDETARIRVVLEELRDEVRNLRTQGLTVQPSSTAEWEVEPDTSAVWKVESR